MSSFSIEDVQTPEDVVSLSNTTNYWVDSGIDAKFFFVDANYAVILLFATIDLYNINTIMLLAGTFLFFAILAIKDLRFMEFVEIIKNHLSLKKVRRH